MKKFETDFGHWVVKYRWLVLIVSILLFLFAASGARFLSFNNDGRVFFSKDNPQLQALEAIENTYNKLENVFYVVAPNDGDVFTRETLSAIEDLTDKAWKIPYSSRVESITNYQHTEVEEDDLIVRDLVENGLEFSDEDLARVKKIALAEPLLINKTISKTGHVTGVNVNILMPQKGANEATEVALFARDIAKQFQEKYPDINLYLTGGVMMDNGFNEASEDDMSTLIPVMFVILLLIVGFSIRSVAGTFGTLVVILLSMFTGLGFAGWTGLSLNPASANAPIIILTLSVADSIHLLVTMFQGMRKGKPKNEAIAESVRLNLQPVFLTSATTAIGFMTMNFSDAPPFRDLGNIVAVGIMAAFVYSVLLLPALMAILPVKDKSREDSECKNCDRLADFVIGKRRALFWVMLAIMIGVSLGTTKIELNDNFVKYFDDRYDFRRATDFTEENLTGFDIIEYSLESGESAGINDPEYLQTVENFANWMREQPKVVHVLTLTDTMKRLNKNMHGDDESYYRIPEKRDLAAQYLLLYEMSLPFGLDLNNIINVDKSATRMIVTLTDTTTMELRATDDRARDWLKANAPAHMFTYGSGISITWAHISERNIHSMLGASFMALALISALLIFALKSFKLGMLSLIPNLAPAFMAFGAWGFLVGRVGLAVSVLVSLTLGIVVDDTVHFLSKYLRGRREGGKSPAEAVRYAFNTVGTALWVTTLALVIGFGILSFSGFKVNSDMGLMTAVTITLALIIDFLFLPTLLMKVEETSDETNKTDYIATPAAAGAGGSGPDS